MDNTLENKAKFFAQYWGQKVYKEWQKADISFVDGNYVGDTDFLQLKPLSAISDEDAREVCKLAIPYTGRYEILEIKNTSIIFRLPFINAKYQIFPTKGRAILIERYEGGKGIVKKDEITPIFNVIAVSDYLRSKGYLLPFNGLSCEEILNRGWAVLEQEVSNG